MKRGIGQFASCTMFLGSLLYIFGMLIGEISIKESPLFTMGLPLLVFMASISYLLYTEITRKKGKRANISSVKQYVPVR